MCISKNTTNQRSRLNKKRIPSDIIKLPKTKDKETVLKLARVGVGGTYYTLRENRLKDKHKRADGALSFQMK